jgi:hypothetical protein
MYKHAAKLPLGSLTLRREVVHDADLAGSATYVNDSLRWTTTTCVRNTPGFITQRTRPAPRYPRCASDQEKVPELGYDGPVPG